MKLPASLLRGWSDLQANFDFLSQNVAKLASKDGNKIEGSGFISMGNPPTNVAGVGVKSAAFVATGQVDVTFTFNVASALDFECGGMVRDNAPWSLVFTVQAISPLVVRFYVFSLAGAATDRSFTFNYMAHPK